MPRFVRFGIVLLFLFLALSLACGNEADMKTRQAPTISPTPDTRPYLEKRAEDIGVKKQGSGHLLIGGQAPVRLLRLLAYFNAEGKQEGEHGTFYSRKVSGAYETGRGACGGDGDCVHYKIHFSDDGKDLNKKVSSTPPYDTLDDLLTRENAEAAANGRQYKLKAWYEQKAQGETLVSDRVDVMIQFSFDMPRDTITPESAISARSFYPLEAKKDAIIARTAVQFSQLLLKGEALTIVALDFTGVIPNAPEWAYMFDEKGVAALKSIYESKIEYDTNAILVFAEVKERSARAESLQGYAKRAKEPVSSEEIEIVARIAQETARVINPSLGLSITIYGFEGRAPKDLTTWVYIFDGRASATLRTKELTPKGVLQLAEVVEQQGEVFGRPVPPVKPILRETGK